jgi:hypothetical protein
LAAQPGRFEYGYSAPYWFFISGLMYLKTQKLHELKKHMKRFWILKIIEKFSLVGVAGFNPIEMMNIIASVQGIVAPLFIVITWSFEALFS